MKTSKIEGHTIFSIEPKANHQHITYVCAIYLSSVSCIKCLFTSICLANLLPCSMLLLLFLLLLFLFTCNNCRFGHVLRQIQKKWYYEAKEMLQNCGQILKLQHIRPARHNAVPRTATMDGRITHNSKLSRVS